MIGNARYDLAQITFRVETIQRCLTDQAINDRGALTVRIRTRKEIILPVMEVLR